MSLNLFEVGRFDVSLIGTKRFPYVMFVLIVDINTNGIVLSPAVEREAVEVVAPPTQAQAQEDRLFCNAFIFALMAMTIFAFSRA